MERLIVYEYPESGNSYKVRLTAALLGLPLEGRFVDILKGESRTPAYLSTINPAGKTPVLQVGDLYLPESNAICLYLAEGSSLVPSDGFERATMLRWMFWEQFAHEPQIATLRFWYAFIGSDKLNDQQLAQVEAKRAAGEAALQLMDDHLARRQYLVGETLTLADIALYAYTHIADEGGQFDLGSYPNVVRWLGTVSNRENWVAIRPDGAPAPGTSARP